ncbi:MAG: YbaK/EbsC family protein [Chloroflexi bacterium]|nr:YbaK/EbsC family protein [Chloroflexota bacterium]MBU1746387.1 YbaK/EbsC family protein [Chloroflexota bacterium]
MTAPVTLAEPIQQVLDACGCQAVVHRFAAGTPTAQAAADAVGCALEQIVKSLVVELETGGLALVIVRGDKRLDMGSLREQGVPVTRLARPPRILAETGFPVGGTPPFGHAAPLETTIDRALADSSVLWFGGGEVDVVFRLTGAELLRCCPNATLIDL